MDWERNEFLALDPFFPIRFFPNSLLCPNYNGLGKKRKEAT